MTETVSLYVPNDFYIKFIYTLNENHQNLQHVPATPLPRKLHRVQKMLSRGALIDFWETLGQQEEKKTIFSIAIFTLIPYGLSDAVK